MTKKIPFCTAKRPKIAAAITGVFVLALMLNVNSFAQFGQNKVQYKVFDWKYIQTTHFDIYFTQKGDYIAQFTAYAAESSLVSIQNNVGYEIKNRIPILIFNSHNEFQQNNAIDEYMPEGVGGVTELFKNRIVVPFEGDYEKFRHVIHHEMLHAFMNDMYYGGSIQNIIAQNIQLQFPGWFSEGMAEYQSLSGNDKANDMFIRDAVIYDYLPPIEYIDGYLSYRGGQSFFTWLAEEYGEEKIGDLMQQIKAVGDVYDGFYDVYKMSMSELDAKWHKHLKQIYWPDINTRQELGDFAVRLTDARNGDGFYNTAPSISPKGDKIAYISNRDDYFGLYIAKVKTGEVIKRLLGSTTSDFDELHLLAPGLCWSPDGKKIAISVKSSDKDAVYIFDVESEDETQLPIKFEGIFTVNWNPNNNSLVLRCDNARQSDIWVYDLKIRKLQQITNDLFSDLSPTWSSDGKKIYFTSDRGDYTDLNSIPVDLDMVEHEYKEKALYVYDMDTKNLSKFSDYKNSHESNVVTSPDGKKVLFVSDRNGINNIWLRDLETNEEKPITNSIDPINLISLSEDGKRLAFNSLNKGGYDIFYIENPFEIDLKIKDLPPTEFVKKTLEADKENLTSTDLDSNKSVVKDSTIESADYALDSTQSIISGNTDDKTYSVYGDGIDLNLKPDVKDTLRELASNNPKLKEKKVSSKFRLKDNLNDDGSFKINKYKIKFSPDIIYSNVNYSSFYGVQGIAQLAFSDILGNHRIYVATSLVLDLKNSDYAFSYYYLPKRIDYGISAYHSARFLLIGSDYSTAQLYRYRTFGGSFSMSFPLSRFNRFDGSLTFNRITKENLDNPVVPNQKLDFLMPIVSYVHDNTLWGFTAPIKGTRYNLTLMGTPQLQKDGAGFFSGILDFRTYFKLFDDYNFVLRFNGGASVGNNPQRFYIGGTENWINYEIQNNVYPVEELTDFAFSTPIMPLRGYNYNHRSGSKFALINAEFRFPLFKYLIMGVLPLGFQNIQGVLFTDIGQVWNENKVVQPFQRVNGSIATKDLMIGMGVGTRLFMLYFPLKFDVAWSYDLQRFSPPKYYISIGADF